MQVAGIGRIIFWSGGSLWIGQSLAPSELHAHHAIQVCVGLASSPEFRTDESAPWTSYRAAVIPPDLPHTYQAPGMMVAHMFCEPESALGRGLLAEFGRERIAGVLWARIDPFARALRSAFDAGAADEELEAIALDTLHALSGYEPGGEIDRRIVQATDFIAMNLAETLSLEDVARHVGLSPGRFRHLFVAETGISFRAYVLWMRMQRAIELGFGSGSWTAAAHATNFADSAHLSRTMRRMYGFAPTALRQDAPTAARQMTA
jgi:AraC family transcriptional regulator